MKLVFKSLINNSACVTGARKRKWWVAIVIGLISILFSIIPTFVQSISTSGSQIAFTQSSYGIEFAIKDFVEENSSTFSLKIENDPANKTHALNLDSIPKNDPYEYVKDGEVDVRFYFLDEGTSTAGLTAWNDTFKPATTLVFTQHTFSMIVINPTLVDGKKGDSVVSALTCENAWRDFKEDTDLFDYFFDIENTNLTENDKYELCRANLYGFIDTSFNYSRVVRSFVSIGIEAALYAGVVLLMGLMVWILTRGKQNVFRMYTFWEGQKIAYWSSLAPGVLAIPLGFLLSGTFGQMLFPLLLGMRCMWLASNTLRPDGSGYEEPKEVKTVNVK